MDADAFFARLAERCTGREVEVPPAPAARAQPSLKTFRAELERVGGTYEDVAPDALHERLAAFAIGVGAKTFVTWRTPRCRALAGALGGAGLEEVLYPTGPVAARRELDRAHLGIVEAQLAISESGTIGLVADRDRARLVSCLPRKLLVILDPSVLVGRIEDVPPFLAALGTLPSAFALLTGPSRTGDIEGRIVIGAHGPAALHVMTLLSPP